MLNSFTFNNQDQLNFRHNAKKKKKAKDKSLNTQLSDKRGTVCPAKSFKAAGFSYNLACAGERGSRPGAKIFCCKDITHQ